MWPNLWELGLISLNIISLNSLLAWFFFLLMDYFEQKYLVCVPKFQKFNFIVVGGGGKTCTSKIRKVEINSVIIKFFQISPRTTAAAAT